MYTLITGHSVNQDDLTPSERRSATKQKAAALAMDANASGSSASQKAKTKDRVVASEDLQPPLTRPPSPRGDDDEYVPSSREP